MSDLKISQLSELNTPNVTDFVPILDEIGTPTTKKISILNLLGNTQQTKTGNYTLVASDNVIFADATNASLTITLPDAVFNKYSRLTIKKKDASINSVTVNTTSSQTIDGGLTAVLLVQYAAITVQSDGTNWEVL